MNQPIASPLANAGTAMVPSLYVIGAQKGGTTFLMNTLQGHPDIFMHPREAPVLLAHEGLEAQLAEFGRMFSGAAGHKHRGIKAADYLGNPLAPRRLTAISPQARLIAVLRNPVQRAVSAYFHFMHFGVLPLAPLNERLPRILRRELPHSAARDLLDWGLYAACLERWLEHFPRRQIHVMLHEEVSKDPAAALAGIWKFLEVEPPTVEIPMRRANDGVYSMARLRLLRLRNPFLFEYLGNDAPLRLKRKKLGPISWPWVAALTALDRLVLKPLAAKRPPPLSQANKSALMEFYREDIGRLEKMLGRELGHWLEQP